MKKEYIKKSIADFGYMDLILKIQAELTRDKLYQFMNEDEYQRLSKKLQEFWLELNKIDIEHGHTPQGNIGIDNES